MLSARKIMCMLLVCLCVSATGFAQQNTTVKPKLFENQPSSISISENLLQSFFSLAKDQETTIAFGPQFSFPCKVLSNVVKYANLQTIIVKSPVFGNAIFQVSRIINEDRSVSYTGRIMNDKAFDGFVLQKQDVGGYQLQKFETDKVLDECKL